MSPPFHARKDRVKTTPVAIVHTNELPQRVIDGPHCRPPLATALLTVLLFVVLSSVAVLAFGAAPGPSITREGIAVIQVVDDFEHGRSQIQYFLHERSSNERLELKLSPEQAKRIRPGQQLRVRGRRSGPLAADPDQVLAVDPDVDAVTVLSEPAALAPPATARRVITLIVDITDGSGARHTVDGMCDGADQRLADEMFGSQTARLNVDGCFGDSSYGALGFGGQSYPGTAMDVVRVAINEPSQSLEGICPYYSWAASADAAAAAQGINLGAYQHRMYVLPEATSGCAWAGLAYLRCGDWCQAWVRAWVQFYNQPCGFPDAIAHELGHNIGLHHASTDSNNDGISDCEYCDMSDVMGYALGTWRAINAPHRDLMGWLGAARIVDGTSGGVFTISALGMQDPPYAQVVKIVPSSGVPYWLSYRAPIGYDAQMQADSYFNSLQVHRADYSGRSYLIAQLADGATHVDENLNLTVRLLSHTADSATMEVRFEERKPAYTLSSSSLVFGKWPLNLASSAKTITLRSTGNTALPITSIAIGGANPGQFRQTNNCGTSVAAGASCTIKVTFKPTSTGSKAATLSVTAGGGAGTRTASLSGAGVRSTFSVSPTALSFGNVARNTSAAKTVRISNTGTVVLPISSITLAGTNPGQFSRTHNCPARVAAGGSCTVRVVFKPTSTGAKTAILRVTPGGGAAQKSVSLSGRGI
jgi:Gametolysin peptidase M11/Abnormal spindle-like microcephaly-assoc'd, ASPM-SPD-2-Hydin